MSSRNRLFMRSVLFGILPKATGSLTVLVGLPALGRALSLPDYAWFLAAMSVTSFMTMPFSAVGTLEIRRLATASTRGELTAAVAGVSLGLFVAAAALGLAAAAVAGAAFGLFDRSLAALVILLAILQGISSWSDAYHVATRTDYVVSLSQLVINLVLVGLFLSPLASSLSFVIVAYFALPVLNYGWLLFRILRRAPVVPTFSWAETQAALVHGAPLLLSGGIDYLKVFGSAALVGAISGEVEYAAYATIVLLVARFTNPMSLITRPLMPALLDAVARSDAAWLINARSAVLLTVGISVVLTAVVGFFLPMVFVLLFPDVLQSVSEIEGYAIAAMLWGFVASALFGPVVVTFRRQGILAVWSAIWVVAGLVAGGIGELASIHGAMLFSMALASIGAGATVSFIAQALLKAHSA